MLQLLPSSFIAMQHLLDAAHTQLLSHAGEMARVLTKALHAASVLTAA